MPRHQSAFTSETLRTAANLFSQRRLDEASQILRDAIAAAESSELWNDWAVVQLALAERAFTRAFELDPWNDEAAANLGILLFSLGKISEAESFLREAALTTQGSLHHHIEMLLRRLRPVADSRAARAGPPERPSLNASFGNPRLVHETKRRRRM